MQDLALERVTLNVADQRARGAAVDLELEHRRVRRHAVEHLLQIARVERQRLGLALVTVHDARNLLRGAQLSRGALAGFRARMRDEDFGCHIDSLGSVIDS